MVTLGNAQVQWVNDAGFPANLISDHSLFLPLSLSVELVNGGGCGRLDASLGFSSTKFSLAKTFNRLSGISSLIAEQSACTPPPITNPLGFTLAS